MVLQRYCHLAGTAITMRRGESTPTASLSFCGQPGRITGVYTPVHTYVLPIPRRAGRRPRFSGSNTKRHCRSFNHLCLTAPATADVEKNTGSWCADPWEVFFFFDDDLKACLQRRNDFMGGLEKVVRISRPLDFRPIKKAISRTAACLLIPKPSVMDMKL